MTAESTEKQWNHKLQKEKSLQNLITKITCRFLCRHHLYVEFTDKSL